jgi:hypothetical protein
VTKVDARVTGTVGHYEKGRYTVQP